jgi:CIC family chloride channel protein
MISAVTEATWQSTFPVFNQVKLVGLVTAASLRAVRPDHDLQTLVIAADFMQAPVTVLRTEDLRAAADRMLGAGLKQIPVVEADGTIVSFLEEADVTKAYVNAVNLRTSG